MSESIAQKANAIMTVKSLRRDMLKYDGKPVRVKALIVDFDSKSVQKSADMAAAFGSKAITATINDEVWRGVDVSGNRGWYIADDLGGYFGNYVDENSQPGSMLIVPAVPTIHYHDYVELEGIYDAQANTIRVTSAKAIGS